MEDRGMEGRRGEVERQGGREEDKGGLGKA